MNQPPDALPEPTPDDHGGLLVYRAWHPTADTTAADTLRTYGPLYRFDPHPWPADAPADDPQGPVIWYGGETLETAVRERLGRIITAGGAPDVVDVCRRYRITALRLARATRLLDLTVHARRLGADDDLGDRIEVDYEETRPWARVFHARPGVHGLRYHSARHRDKDGGRAGMNVALWSRTHRPEPVSEVRVDLPGAWRRIEQLLVRAGGAPRLMHSCRACLR